MTISDRKAAAIAAGALSAFSPAEIDEMRSKVENGTLKGSPLGARLGRELAEECRAHFTAPATSRPLPTDLIREAISGAVATAVKMVGVRPGNLTEETDEALVARLEATQGTAEKVADGVRDRTVGATTGTRPLTEATDVELGRLIDSATRPAPAPPVPPSLDTEKALEQIAREQRGRPAYEQDQVRRDLVQEWAEKAPFGGQPLK